MLKQYMIENGGDVILQECENAANQNVGLTDSQKTRCVNFIANYGVLLFGLTPLTHQYKLLAYAAIDLIPALKSKSQSPIVSFQRLKTISVESLIEL